MPNKLQLLSGPDWADQQDQWQRNQPGYRWHIYNDLPRVSICLEVKLTTETREQADQAFAELQPHLIARKINAKERYWPYLYHAGKVAYWRSGCIAYPRNEHHADYSRMRLQVIEAAIAAGYFNECRSPKGSPKMSRLIPTTKLGDLSTLDPWAFDPQRSKVYVRLRDRKTKDYLPVEFNDPIPASIQHRLETVNRVNSVYTITYETWDGWEEQFTNTRRLRPIHYAVFTDSFELQGRLYTGKYGHQGLMKRERGTIRFNGKRSIEYDYSGLHPRLLYHLEGIDYRRDPYALWGKETTPPMRRMAKVFINCLINARNPQAAISAANRAMCTKTTTGERKQGKSLEDARKLYDAWLQTEIKFADMLPLAYRYHARIKHRFGVDMGVRLMRIDSAIALDILHHFAAQSIPCLSTHDSFTVPCTHGDELFRVMNHLYYDRVGYYPLVERIRV